MALLNQDIKSYCKGEAACCPEVSEGWLSTIKDIVQNFISSSRSKTQRPWSVSLSAPGAFKKATNFGNAVIANSRVHDYVIVIHQIYYDVGNMFEIRSVVSNQY
ncbi:hypothetical protein CK516_10675 [Nostoc sp. 'Peltigera malacea cyanobiont' DB3992]|nr:hypothetical protein CK516_10675 [Nostoc sp. 'Peltigera malacea cyanobiont' DB3992]